LETAVPPDEEVDVDYFRPYRFSADETIVAAWDAQLAVTSDILWIRRSLAAGSPELFACFAESYSRVRALPRSRRRALKRELAAFGALSPIPSSRRRKLAQSLAGAALLLALAQAADAATITVTTNIPDINDGDGKCSLIEAIVNANDGTATHPDCAAGDPGANTIVLPKKTTHTLTAIDNSLYGPTGLPVIKTFITIQGNGGKITRSKSSPEFRLVTVGRTGFGMVERLNFSGGVASGHGGGLLNYGVLFLDSSDISANEAVIGHGGGIANRYGTLIVNHAAVSGNIARGEKYFYSGGGGGIHNIGGTAFIYYSSVSGNRSLYESGGGILSGPQPTYTKICATVIANNSALRSGGGVHNDLQGRAIIENSVVSGNKTNYDGGGIYSRGYLFVTRSTISGNSAISASPGEYSSFGGGIYNSYGILVIENSTISGNKVKSFPYDSYGGGIAHYGGNMLILNSTISGNSAGFGGGIYTGSGYYDETSTTIENSTVTNNTALAGGGIFDIVNKGAGYLNRSLISGNEALIASEIGGSTYYLYGDNFNLIGTNGDAGAPNFLYGPSDIVPSVPIKKILGPLKNNGGPTQTHALVKASPAMDGAPADSDCPATDQRGVARPRGPGCDIGAFER
jgi:hypothetical protein